MSVRYECVWHSTATGCPAYSGLWRYPGEEVCPILRIPLNHQIAILRQQEMPAGRGVSGIPQREAAIRPTRDTLSGLLDVPNEKRSGQGARRVSPGNIRSAASVRDSIG